MAQKGSFRRKAVGAGALGLVALGIWLGQYFPGFGLGKGLGFGTGAPESGSSAKDDAESGRPSDASTTLVSIESPSRPATPPVELVRVVIDGDRFLVASDAGLGESKAVDATEIAQRVKATTGDDQGIRIRIERTKRATAGARQSLLKALDSVGIPRDARQESEEFLDTVH